MINWYIPLYLGVMFILYIFEHVGSARKGKDYIRGGYGSVGLSWGTNLILSRIISPEVILFSVMAVMYFGLWGGLVVILVEFISLFFVYYVVIKAKNTYSKENIDLPELINSYFYGSGLNLYNLILTLCLVGKIILELYILRVLLGDTFSPYQFGILMSLCVLAFIYAGLGGFSALCKGSRPMITLVYFSVSVITIFTFLEKGLINTYEDLNTLTTFPTEGLEGFSIIVGAIIWRFTYYLTDHSLWNITGRIKPHRLKTIFLIATLCLIAIPLSISSLTIFSASQGFGSPKFSDNIISIFNNSDLLLVLYICLVLVVTVSNVSINLHSLISLYLLRKPPAPFTIEINHLKKAYLIGFLIIFATFLLAVNLNLSLHNYMVLLGIFCSSLVIPFIRTLANKPLTKAIYVIFISSLILGLALYFLGYSYSFVFSLFMALIVSLIVDGIKKVQKIL